MKGREEDYDKNAFFTRNYENALKNVERLCDNASVTEKDKITILKFFNYYWNLLATQELPCVALVKRNDIIAQKDRLMPLENESAPEFVKRSIAYYTAENHIVKSDIAKEKITIFPYQLEKISIVQPKKGNIL